MLQEHWGSIKDFLWRTLHAGWALAGGIFVYLVVLGIGKFIHPLSENAAWEVGGLVILVCAPYQAFHSLRMEASLTMPSAIESDWPVKAAVLTIGPIYEAGGRIEYGEIFRDLQQQVANGKMFVWGRRLKFPAEPDEKSSRPEILIPKEYWIDHEFDYNSCMVKGPSRTKNIGRAYVIGDIYYYDLSVNRKQLASWWPVGLTLRQRIRNWVLRRL